MPEVIAAGESMVLGVPAWPGRLRHAPSLELKIGGAESNVAIALCRLNISTGWIGYLGADETGQLVLDRIRAEGVDTSRVRRFQSSSTGLYLRENLGGEVRAYYYRKESAASLMAPEAFDPDYLNGTRYLHLTGITPALSFSCKEFVRWAAKEACARNVKISFDVNYRSKLWSSQDAKEFVEEMLPIINVLFVGAEEASAIWGEGGEELLRKLASMGPHEIVLRRGKEGSQALIDGRLFEQSAFTVAEVDPVGAGDAFVAGYLAGHLWELPSEERLRVANAMGSYSVMTLGDYEGLPSQEELRMLLEGKGELGR